MIKNWLQNHWWLNEGLKFMVFIFFAELSRELYLASHELQSYGVAFVGGVAASVGMVFLIDLLSVLLRKAKGKPLYNNDLKCLN